MKLLPELAKKVIDEVRLTLNESLIVMDEEGVIIAATEQERIGSIHQGAKTVLKNREKLYINEQNIKMLKGVKLGINLPIQFEGKIIGVLGVTGHPQKIEAYADLVRKMTELMIKETYYIEQKEWQKRGIEAFFHEWIHAENMEDSFIQRRQLLGIAIGTAYTCISIKALDSNEKSVYSFMNEWFTHAFPKRQNDVFIRTLDGDFLLLRTVKKDEQELERIQSELLRWRASFLKVHQSGSFHIGIGHTLVDHQIKWAYNEANKACKAANQSKPLVFYNELLLDMLLSEIDVATQGEFMARILRSLSEEADLLRTIRAYLYHNQSIVETAKALHIHKNTLHYRLNQISLLTDIDVKSSFGITVFYLALLFAKENAGLFPLES
ncbi:CdaR family transcriptional regulator [Alkalihalobacillus pseudalcaliphilus]|uniref:CdaR family transcriptional regulator n=1 Tax=Alkalihalobacillus pseudalcaliphilus TaxID=79884 RepID=UPI00064D9D63|nr:sugar diacid recognition domain-containing protein [Alkalihalobacillus pseudalcaliphilus]KMK75362.1 hypothetical protein AB990_16700 [Alkalihalobacillus pseudalcaliphilus]